MNNLDKEIEAYISEIKKNLLCSTSQKNSITSDLRNSVIDFADSNNIDDINDIYAHFGTPQDIANQSISETEPQKLKKKFNLRKIVIIGVLIAVLIFAVVIIWAAIDGHKSVYGYFVESVQDVPQATVLANIANNIL